MNQVTKTIALIVFALLAVVGDIAAVQAEPTEVVVRARAKDAKFIGTSIGGARVLVREAESGRILAEGLTSGSTGNTETIMKQPHRRYQRIAEGAAEFRASLDIDEPVFVTIEVLAPYIKKQARILATTQTWLVPGKNIDGDGLVIEIPGMVVDILSPQTHRYTSIGEAPFEIRANVVMMCGCPISDGGLWDGSKMEVAAVVQKDGNAYKTIPLALTAENTFAAKLEPTEPGVYELLVYAFDERSGNTGVDRVSFIVRK